LKRYPETKPLCAFSATNLRNRETAAAVLHFNSFKLSQSVTAFIYRINIIGDVEAQMVSVRTVEYTADLHWVFFFFSSHYYCIPTYTNIIDFIPVHGVSRRDDRSRILVQANRSGATNVKYKKNIHIIIKTDRWPNPSTVY